MEKYLNTFVRTFQGNLNWTWDSITFQVPLERNFFWGLVVISLVVWGLEITFPWRKEQRIFRKDFWMDGFYMFFNFFIFSIMISGVYAVLGVLFAELSITRTSLALIDISSLPSWAQLVIFFIILDFVQWLTHIALHRSPVFWRFHKVHHSVLEMGFAAHLRYHWMENVLYKPLKTLGVMILGGFQPEQAFIVHFIAITIGHLNHSNIKITWGPLKYIFNNPVMHLYHHAKHLPRGRETGVNFGISLSLWDYLFRTSYVPEDSGKIELGFDEVEKFPTDFVHQNLYGFGKEKK